MKIAYKMFHIEGNESRKKNVDIANKVFRDFDYFDTPTYKISNNIELIEFVRRNKSFYFDQDGYNLDNKQGWRYGELGIWASNWTAWNNFAESDYDYLVLMEDDLVCQEGLAQVIVNYIQEVPNDFDALFMFVPADQMHKYDKTRDISTNITGAYQDWSCACYIVNKNTIRDMIDIANGGFSLPLDWFMFRQQNIFNVYSVKPGSYQACKTENVESTFQTTQEREIINGIF
jgi:GR25 family glycosyltransferase involved in LPS biosynthesis